VDIALIRYVASTGKPMIISTGMANDLEIEEAVNAANEGGCKEIALLHCVSGYPAPASEYNLRTIPDMLKRFNQVTGISDHTLENTTAISSISLGASIIEKHFTLDRSRGGPDDSFSLEESDLRELCTNSRTAWDSLGKINYLRTSSEESNLKFRRSLYFVKDIKSGEKISNENVRSIRPGYGLSPSKLESILGKVVIEDVFRGMPVTLDLLKD
jgi:N-acetylneuraminate synthase